MWQFESVNMYHLWVKPSVDLEKLRGLTNIHTVGSCGDIDALEGCWCCWAWRGWLIAAGSGVTGEMELETTSLREERVRRFRVVRVGDFWARASVNVAGTKTSTTGAICGAVGTMCEWETEWVTNERENMHAWTETHAPAAASPRALAVEVVAIVRGRALATIGSRTLIVALSNQSQGKSGSKWRCCVNSIPFTGSQKIP